MILGIYFLGCTIWLTRHININQIMMEDAVDSQGNLCHPTALLPDSVSEHIIVLITHKRNNVLFFQMLIFVMFYFAMVMIFSYLFGIIFFSGESKRFGWGLLVYILLETVAFGILSFYSFWRSVKKTHEERLTIRQKMQAQAKGSDTATKSELQQFVAATQPEDL